MLAHDLRNIFFEEVKRSRMGRLMFIANGHTNEFILVVFYRRAFFCVQQESC